MLNDRGSSSWLLNWTIHATQEEVWSVQFQSTPKSDKEKEVNSKADELLDNMLLKDLEENEEYKKDSSFVFRETMLDEFMDQWN